MSTESRPIAPTGVPCHAAVVFAEAAAAAGLRDRFRGARRFDGAGFVMLLGRVEAGAGPVDILACTPRSAGGVDYPPLISAVVAAHRPVLIVGAGFVEPRAATCGGALDWRTRFESACARLGVDGVAVSVPGVAEAETEEQRNVDRQSTLVGAAGAVLRMAVRRPTGLPALWRRRELLWQSQERLADAVLEAIARRDGPAGGASDAAARPRG